MFPRRMKGTFRSSDRIQSLKEIKDFRPDLISDLKWEDYMFAVAWVVLKSTLYSDQTRSILSIDHKDEVIRYQVVMRKATDTDKKFIGTMANLILRKGGYL